MCSWLVEEPRNNNKRPCCIGRQRVFKKVLSLMRPSSRCNVWFACAPGLIGYVHTNLIRFRMPPFLIQRKRIQISASTLAFLNRFRPSSLAMRKRYVFVLRGRLIIEFMTSAFSKISTLEGVFESLRFRGSRYPFSIVLMWTTNEYKSMRFQMKTD